MSEMTLRMLRVAVALAAGLLGQNLVASTTVAVGPTNCQPALVHFSTIQAAINASPQGGTILVCPGTYPEQISIFHPLTIKGVDYNGSNLALITMPPGAVGDQVYVQATGVNLSDLTIDGSNNGATGCGQGPNGIVYVGSSGVINHVAVRNEIPTGQPSCYNGDGIFVYGFAGGASTVTIENSSIHAFQWNGIEANGTDVNVTIKNNTIGGNTVGPAGNGIALWFGASGTISGNSIVNVLEPVTYPNLGGAGYGIIIECSQGVVVTDNTIGDTQNGIDLVSFSSCKSGNANGNTITRNTISQTHLFDAIYVCGNYNLVQNNTINSTSEGAINIDTSCNTGASGYYNNFTSNTVNEACMTALVNPAVAGFNTIGSNFAYNDVFDLYYGAIPLAAGTCSGAPPMKMNSETSVAGLRRLNFDDPRFHHPSLPSH